MKITKELGRNPHMDWLGIILLSIIVVIGLAFAGYSLYNAVVGGEIKDKDAKTNPAFIQADDKLISSVFNKFSDREEASKKIRAGYTAPPDPSI
jgi:hypothetical protein